MTKKIRLTNGKYVLVDGKDYNWLNRWKWYAHGAYTRKDGETLHYAYRHLDADEQEREGRKLKSMGEEILGPPGGSMVVGYLNHNTLDNQRSNLKFMTRREVAQRARRPRTSQYPGVSFDKKLDKWRVDVGKDQKMKCIGLFPKEQEEDAYDAYITAINELNKGKTLESIKTIQQPHSSKYKGVSWDKNKKKWIVQVIHEGKKKFLGNFAETEEGKAGEAYQNAVKELEAGIPLDKITTYTRKRKYKYKDVYPIGNRWVARLWADGKYLYLGSFDTEYEAHQVQLKTARKYKKD